MSRADAEALAAAGWPVFPCRDKRPLSPGGFRDASTTVSAWPDDAQIAIAIPPGMLVVDVDDAAGLVALEQTHGPLPPTLTATSGKRGEHRYYRTNGTPTTELVQRKLGPGVDTRIGGKGYVIAPPSTHHETGRPYAWQNSLPVADAPEWLLSLLTPAAPASPSPTPTDRNADHLQAARAFLATVPPALEGRDSDGKGTTGGTHTFATCVKVVRGFNLSDVAALAALEDWNARCEPPWDEYGLRRKVREAAEKGDMPWGGMIPDHELLAAIRPAVVHAGPLDADDIFAPLPPVDYLVHGIGITRGPPGMIAGYGYSGKTAAVQQMAIDLARADHAGAWMMPRPVWGKFPAGRRARVLHVDYEQGSHLTRRRYQRIARAAGVDPRELQGWLRLVAHPGWYFNTKSGFDALERAAEGFDLVVIDSYRAGCPGTDENSSEAREPLDALNMLSDKHGYAFIVIHHAKKPDDAKPMSARTAVRGSGALFDAPGSVLVFVSEEKNAPKRVYHEKEKHTGHTEDDFALIIEDAENDGLRVRAQDLVVKTPAERSSAEMLDDAGKLKEWLRINVFFKNRNQIAKALGISTTRASAAMGALETAGELTQSGSYHDRSYHLTGKPT